LKQQFDTVSYLEEQKNKRWLASRIKIRACLYLEKSTSILLYDAFRPRQQAKQCNTSAHVFILFVLGGGGGAKKNFSPLQLETMHNVVFNSLKLFSNLLFFKVIAI
jgi:hypothetical protein